MTGKKEQEAEANVKFRGVSPFGQTTESDAIDYEEPGTLDRAAVDKIIRSARPRTVKAVVGSVLPVLEQLLAKASDVELSNEAATTLRLAVAGVAKEGLVRAKK